MTQSDSYTIKEMVEKLDKKVSHLDSKVDTLLTLAKEVEENTTFRKKAVNAIVGAAFLALAALGAAVLKITGILKI